MNITERLPDWYALRLAVYRVSKDSFTDLTQNTITYFLQVLYYIERDGFFSTQLPGFKFNRFHLDLLIAKGYLEQIGITKRNKPKYRLSGRGQMLLLQLNEKCSLPK